MTKDEALRMALDELCRVYHDDEADLNTLEVIITIKQVLEQRNLTKEEHDVLMSAIKSSSTIVAQGVLEQPEPEPVAHCVVRPLQGYESIPQTRIEWKNGKPVAGPLYTTPPKREPLTDEQLKPLIQKAMMYYGHNPDHWTLTAGAGFCLLARAIEKAHGIGEKK